MVEHGYGQDADLQCGPHGDGVPLLLAHAPALDPREPWRGSLPVAERSGNTHALAFSATRSGINYIAEPGNDLSNRSTGNVALSAPDANGHRTASLTIAGPRGYLRLRVTP